MATSQRKKVSSISLSSFNSEAFDSLADGIYFLNNDLEYIYMNKAAEKYLILPKNKMIGKKIQEIYPKVFTTSTGKAIEEALKTRKQQQLEMQYSVANKWLLNTIYPLSNGLAIQVHDISIRKNNENNLTFLAKASKELSSSLDYQQTLTSVADLAVPLIGDWCAIDMIRDKNQISHIATKHIDPKKIKLAEEFRKKFPQDLSSDSGMGLVVRTGKSQLIPVITEQMIESASGSTEYKSLIKKIGFTSIMIVPLTSKNNVIGTITFVTSETKRHYTPTDLSMAEELAVRASLAIENARLYKEARGAIQLRNEFISVASHELKTPVTSIKAYAQMLQRRFMKQGNSEEAVYLGKMDHQLNKLSGLIGDLLDVTKIEAGKLMLHKEYYEFDELIQDTVDQFRHTITHSIKITGQTGLKIYGDKDRTGQVLINLLSNAAKYSPEAKEIHLHIKEDQDMVSVSVTDFGVGIPKEMQSKVFNRFYRASGPNGETFPGLGLGLYISYEIIKRQGGKIKVKSTPGEGSEFSFFVPIFSDN